MISVDAHAPNVLHIDRNAEITMTPIDINTYIVDRGRQRLGEIVFLETSTARGWRYLPRSNHIGPSRKLHRDATSAVRRLGPIRAVYRDALFDPRAHLF